MNTFKENNHSFLLLTDQLTSHYQIPFRSLKKESLATVLDKIEKSEEGENREVQGIRWYFKAAISAAAVIAVLIAFYLFTADVTITSGDDDIVTCRLPDMSRVVLQQNSTVEYSKYFWSGEVNLTGGAYFEVTKGDRFIVNTELGIIEVLGTRFMVNSGNSEFNVVCYQGSVKAGFSSDFYILEPGTRFSGSKNSVKKDKLGDGSEYPEFALFSNSYTRVPIKEVLDNIGNFFGVKIDIQSGIMNNFSGSIQTGNLNSALEIVCVTLQLRFKMTDEGSYIVYRE